MTKQYRCLRLKNRHNDSILLTTLSKQQEEHILKKKVPDSIEQNINYQKMTEKMGCVHL